jgi:serine-type D-Ala-D-Ala carboxypeptidase/endopeptidase (penicillin-binding protein 4)
MRRSLTAVLALTCALAHGAHVEAATDPLVDLRTRVLRAIEGSTASQIGVGVVVEGVSGRAVDVAGARPLPPASTQKLYTAAAALLTFGPEHRLRTEVRATAERNLLGVIDGDIVLVGGGDPGLRGDDLQRLAFELANGGVRRVTGGIWADDSRYDGVRRGNGWKAAFVPEESGPLSALVVDGNTWRRDSAFINDPRLPNGERFRVALERAGIAVDGPTRPGPPPVPASVLLATHDSEPLGTIVGRMLKHSDNLVSELVLKELGRTIGQPTANGGTEVVWRLAESFGMGRGQAADGSGLSTHDRAAPLHEVDWLVNVSRTTMADNLRLSLPLACGDGTLQQRFCGTPAHGKVFAKTGTLTGVSTLAGYTTTASGRAVVFSFELAGTTSTSAARAAIDRAVIELTKWTG